MFLLIGGCVSNPSRSPGEVEADLARALEKTATGLPDGTVASLYVHSPSRGITVKLQADSDGPVATAAPPFHGASVGKLFTAAVVGMMVDEGTVTFDTPVASVLDPGVLDGLFVVDGIDYQDTVTVAHLLSHTSGAADYYGDSGVNGFSVSDLMVNEPERRWSPAELVDFSRREQSAVGTPGDRYHYSDTGYIVLGLLIEAVSGQAFTEVLAERIFEPLGMDRTWMPFRSVPLTGSTELRAAWVQGTEVSTFPSITADWSGGGVASTEEDLIRFSTALWSGRLVSPATLQAMTVYDHQFMKGVDYGLGIMRYRFGEFFFLLKDYPDMVGHMGVLGTQLFYDPVNDLHIVISLGSDAAIEDSVRLLIRALGMVRLVP